MNNLKLYDKFQNEEPYKDNQDQAENQFADRGPNTHVFDAFSQCYHFRFIGNRSYQIKIYPKWDVFQLIFNEYGIIWFSATAVEKNKSYFDGFEEGSVFYNWVVKITTTYLTDTISSLVFADADQEEEQGG